jgi:hypothetical protein
MALQPAAGAKDLNPRDVERNRQICDQLAAIYRLWGYQEVTPPSFERLDTLERLLEAKGVVDRAGIEAFAPTGDQAAERGLWMQEYLNRVLRTLQQEAEAVQARDDLASEEVAVEVSKADA